MADQESPTATHNSPRTWLLTASLSPLTVRLIRQLLSHGDSVAACFPPLEIEHEERSAEFRELIDECTSGRKDREGWKDRIRGIRCDGRTMSGCGAAVAEAVEVFGRIDILLCCRSEGMSKKRATTIEGEGKKHHTTTWTPVHLRAWLCDYSGANPNPKGRETKEREREYRSKEEPEDRLSRICC